jgi:RND family efflux transporter MFP subunit
MTNSSEKINQLKIDRNTSSTTGHSWKLPGIAMAIVVLVVAGWVLLGRGPAPVLVETDIARKPPSVAAANSVLDASGYVVARQQATVSSKVTGKVVEVLVEEGMRVEQGQILARLDDTTEQAQLALAQAQAQSSRASLEEIKAGLRNAQLERDRYRDLTERNLASQSSLDAAEAAYEQLAASLETGRENVKVAESSIALARDALSNMTITAPFSGMVVSKNAQPGEMISPISAGGGFTRTGICTIIDTDSLEIEVDVNEAYIQRVKPGQRVSATLDAYSDWHIPAEVIAIIPTADRQKATVQVRIGLLERDERILRDMGAKVSFLGSEMPAEIGTDSPGVMINSEALRSDASGDFVWLVRNNIVEKRPIRLAGERDRTQILVLDGLTVGDIIVRSSDAPLVAGQAIRTQ